MRTSVKLRYLGVVLVGVLVAALPLLAAVVAGEIRGAEQTTVRRVYGDKTVVRTGDSFYIVGRSGHAHLK